MVALALVVSLLGASESFQFDALEEAERKAKVEEQRLIPEPVRARLRPAAPSRPSLLELEPEQVALRSTLSALTTAAVSFGAVLAGRYVPWGLTVAAVNGIAGPSASFAELFLTGYFIGLPLFTVLVVAVAAAAIAALMIGMVGLSGLSAPDRALATRNAVLPAVLATTAIVLAIGVASLFLNPLVSPLLLAGVTSGIGLVAGAIVPIVAAARTPGPEPALPVASF